MNTLRLRIALVSLLVIASGLSARAQWLTQVNNLKAGWNAVYLHVDASHTNVNDLVSREAGNPIQEIWQWQPALPTGQFTESPQLPTSPGTQWARWTRRQPSWYFYRKP